NRDLVSSRRTYRRSAEGHATDEIPKRDRAGGSAERPGLWSWLFHLSRLRTTTGEREQGPKGETGPTITGEPRRRQGRPEEVGNPLLLARVRAEEEGPCPGPAAG